MTKLSAGRLALTAAAAALVLSACGGGAGASSAVTITGSATVAPIAQINAREASVGAEINAVGTNDGFEEFCAGNADIANASVQISAGSAAEQCEANGVDYIEVPIGVDALSIVRNVDNHTVGDITMDELAQIWASDSDVTTWSDVRDEWPDEEIVLYGRDEGSGTFSVFTEEVVGTEGDIRDDYEHTDDLDELASWVADEPYGLAFMGVGNYLAATEEDRALITTVDVDGVSPDLGNSLDDSYPLARTLYMYVSVESLENNDDVDSYVRHLLDNGGGIVPRAFFYPLDEDGYAQSLELVEDRVTGTSD